MKKKFSPDHTIYMAARRNAGTFGHVKWQLLAAALIFLGFTATFDFLRRTFGQGATAFALVPVIVITWFFGILPGLASAIITMLTTIIILAPIQSKSLLQIMQDGGLAGFVTTILTVFITGYFHKMHKQLDLELAERSKTEEALRQNEKIFRRMFDQSPIGTAIVTLDYRFQRANPAFCLMVGYTEEELCQHTFIDITDPEIIEEELALVKKLESEEIDQFQMDKRYIHRSGKAIWVQVSVRVMRDSAGHALYFLPMMVDITDRKQAEAALATESSINAAMVDMSRALMSETTLAEMPDLVLEHAMRLTMSEIGFVGYIDQQTGSLISKNRNLGGIELCNYPIQQQIFHEFTGLWGWVLKNKQSIIANHPQDDSRASGLPAGHIPIRRFLSAPAIIDDHLTGLIALANPPNDYDEADLDIVERLATLYGAAVYQQQLQEMLYTLSMHDPLTGLHNRRYFNEEVHRLKESNQFPVCIIFCDVDQLKIVNDQYGHMDGDEVIRRAARILKSTFRSEDIVARTGGDEFVVLLLNTHAEAAVEAVRRIKEKIELDNQHNGAPLVMMSLGTAFAEHKGQLDEAVIKADAAMYLDKQYRRQKRN